MTAILRPFKQRFAPSPEQRSRFNGQEARSCALTMEIEDMDRDAERLCREARDRVEQERRYEAER